MTNKYFSPQGGLPPQTQIMTDRAMFTDAYAVIPKGTYSDIVTSFLPFWTGMRMWVIARPMSGFAETFSHYIVELTSGGGSDRPEDDEEAQAVLFVTAGSLRVTYEGKEQVLDTGGYAYLPASSLWSVRNPTNETTNNNRRAGASIRIPKFNSQFANFIQDPCHEKISPSPLKIKNKDSTKIPPDVATDNREAMLPELRKKTNVTKADKKGSKSKVNTIVSVSIFFSSLTR